MTQQIEVFTRNSICIRGTQKTIYVDPFQMRTAPKDADYILITHDHFDHFSPEDIEKVSSGTSTMIVPEKMLDKAQDAAAYVGEIDAITSGETRKLQGFEIEAVPSYNNSKPFHPKDAGWVGYLINIDGKKIFVAGDTDANKDNLSVVCDVALVPAGGTYTMDAREAAEYVNKIKPSVAIPVHYGSKTDADTFAANVDSSIAVEIKMQYFGEL